VTTPVPLYEHTPASSEVPGLQHMSQTVRLTKDASGIRVWVGWACYNFDQARDLAATILAAVQIGEQAG